MSTLHFNTQNKVMKGTRGLQPPNTWLLGTEKKNQLDAIRLEFEYHFPHYEFLTPHYSRGPQGSQPRVQTTPRDSLGVAK